MSNQNQILEPVLLDITHKLAPSRYEELRQYVINCKNFCIDHNVSFQIITDNGRCFLYIEDQELAIKFKLIYG